MYVCSLVGRGLWTLILFLDEHNKQEDWDNKSQHKLVGRVPEEINVGIHFPLDLFYKLLSLLFVASEFFDVGVGVGKMEFNLVAKVDDAEVGE